MSKVHVLYLVAKVSTSTRTMYNGVSKRVARVQDKHHLISLQPEEHIRLANKFDWELLVQRNSFHP